MDRAEHTEQRGPEQHVVEMGDNEVSVVEVDVDGHSRHEEATQATDNEESHERHTMERRCIKRDLAAPHRADPVKDFHGRGKGNHHRRDHEGHAQSGIHSACEHVMAPHDKPETRNRGHRINHGLVAEDGLSHLR